jgi:hypothetical protein
MGDDRDDCSEAEHDGYFREGTIVTAPARVRQDRRFAMVSRVDALIGIGGTRGTPEQLRFARAAGKPFLPVPSFPGESREFWNVHKRSLCVQLRLAPTAAASWEFAPESSFKAERLAQDMVRHLLGAFSLCCFVAMPISKEQDTLYAVIEAVITRAMDCSVRVDRQNIPGDVVQQINTLIRRADYAVVVLDGLRPNVLYELGLADALNKPTILISRNTCDLPFDIRNKQRIKYVSEEDLTIKLQGAIERVHEAMKPGTLIIPT